MKTPGFASNSLLWSLGGIASFVALLWIVLAVLFFSGPEESPGVADQPLKETPAPSSASSEPTASEFPSSDSVTDYESAEEELPEDPAEETEVFEEAWQKTIHAILMDDSEPAMLSGRLAAALPGMPVEGQLEAAQHMVNLLGDEEYTTAETVYFNPGMAEPVRRLVFEDFMNRPNTLKLPLLVRTLRDPMHPLRTEALENLQVFIGRDEGNDPAQWEASVRELLDKERREEEALAAEES
jgi:hypothetical protein